MEKKKLIRICTAAALALALILGGYMVYQNYIYHATYILIDGVAYRRAAQSLDLSGKPLGEVEKLQELTGLKALDLTGCGITEGQYEALQGALPECDITWSVPFQGGFVSSDQKRVKVTDLDQEDVEQLRYLPKLIMVQATGCRDYEVLMKLERDRPDLTVAYTVPMGTVEYSNQAERITVKDPALADLKAGLPLLPRVKGVRLEGTPMPNQDTRELLDTFPALDFTYQVVFQGVAIDSDAAFADLSGIQLTDTAELESLLPLLPNLTQVDMVDCGISNEEMEALNLRQPEVKFVWEVKVGTVKLRTDVTYFMPYKLKAGGLGDCYNLRYCHDMVVMDFGHYGISNVDFISYMPKLEYLLLYEATIRNLDVIGDCTSLRFLELNATPVSDFWPLTNLTNLEDLNISCTSQIEHWVWGPFGDITPLLQMTWLDHLWMVIDGNHSRTTKNLLKENLPNTTIHFYSAQKATIGEGWRHTRNYYRHRDIMEMWYLT